MTDPTLSRRSSWGRALEIALKPFADVRSGEATTALLLTLDVFLLLTAYYLLKVAREPLILLGGGAEVKSYASVGQSILLVFVASGYGWLASRLGRMALITWVTLIFVANLVIFWALGESGLPLGVPFFLWVGIFNLTAIAQFWSFAADIYPDEQGKRLFPLIGIGSSVGAVAGAWIADALFFLGPFRLMLLSALLLLATLGLTFLVHRRERERAVQRGALVPDSALSGAGGFSLVLRDRYLLFFAALLFVLNWVTKTGDYVFDRKILQAAQDLGHSTHEQATLFIGQFKARYFQWTNVLGVLLQLFVVSRVVKYLGLRAALLLIPLASLGGYASALLFPGLMVLFVARAAESSLDYSLSNTARQALWLVTPREAKYKAKQVIDTFVVRAGDAASAGLVWFGTQQELQLSTFLEVNVALSALWLVVAALLGSAYAKRAGSTEHAAPLLGAHGAEHAN
jgi:AAA family ATP:ADP antiporter